jgi:hypothetical protein
VAECANAVAELAGADAVGRIQGSAVRQARERLAALAAAWASMESRIDTAVPTDFERLGLSLDVISAAEAGQQRVTEWKAQIRTGLSESLATLSDLVVYLEAERPAALDLATRVQQLEERVTALEEERLKIEAFRTDALERVAVVERLLAARFPEPGPTPQPDAPASVGAAGADP